MQTETHCPDCGVGDGLLHRPDCPRLNRQSVDQKPKRGKSAASLANLKGGSRKGKPNKTTALLKDAILKAAEEAGGEGGMVGYLTKQATQNPQSFLPLLGKVLPMQVTGEGDGPLTVVIRKFGA